MGNLNASYSETRATRGMNVMRWDIRNYVVGTGNTVLTPEFIEALCAARDAHGVLLVVDDVATGFGRTGPLFASSEWPWAPDLMVTSKGFSNGTSAIAAILAAQRIARIFHNAPHTI